MIVSKCKPLTLFAALAFTAAQLVAADTGQARQSVRPASANLEEIPYQVVPAEELDKETSPPPAVGDVYLEQNTPAENTPAENTPAENTPAENTPAENTPVENTPGSVRMPLVERNWFGSDFLGGSLLGNRSWGSGLIGSQLRRNSTLAGAIRAGPDRQWWARAEYLVSWRRGQDIPALATTGILGEAGTEVLLGNERIDDDSTPGGRIDFGFWMPARNRGLGARFLSLGSADNLFQFPLTANTAVTRPYFNVDSNLEDALLVNLPGSELGSLSTLASSDVLGLDVYVRRPWRQSGNATVDFLWGYQMSRIDESLLISSSSVNLDGAGGAVVIGTQIDVEDSFQTRNEFHGGMLGLLAEIEGGRWSFNMLAKVGLGNMNQKVMISGQTTFTVPGQNPVTSPGLLAAASNQGIEEEDRFAAVPEFELRYNYHLNETVEVSIGYSCIYWSQAVQPGNQLDLNVDLVNGTAPILSIESDKYWMHALSMGASWQF